MSEFSRTEPGGADVPVVVVMAYNRPSSLSRLLRSLERASVPAGTNLIISIDGGGSHQADVTAVADRFAWANGDKQVQKHEHLGLVDHWHHCGDLTDRFGSVVLLEDDLVVGPNFHRWATAALAAARTDARVAGVCLAAPWFDGYRHLPFTPILDGSAGWYLQIPWFHGMAWTATMWGHYRQWSAAQSPSAPQSPSSLSQSPSQSVPIHAAFDRLDQDEWFPDAVRYLVDTNRFYLMPREARVTNTGAAGQHFDQATDFFQVPVQVGDAPVGTIVGLDRALAVYDDHLEPTPSVVKRLCPDLAELDLTIDLLAVRDPATITTEWVVTTRAVTTADREWGLSLRPPVMNLVEDSPGRGIALARTAALRTDRVARAATDTTLMTYAAHGRPPGLRAALAGRVGRLARRWLK